jgi:hypothetical protein
MIIPAASCEMKLSADTANVFRLEQPFRPGFVKIQYPDANHHVPTGMDTFL